MKVLYLITKGIWGGAQRYVYDLAVVGRTAGHEVVVVCGEGGALPEKLAAAGIRTGFLESLGRDVNPLIDWQNFRALYRLYQTERPDIIHLNSSKIGGLGALAGRIYNLTSRGRQAKIIYTAHGWAWNEERPFWQRWPIKFLSWLTILLCHRVVAIAQRERDQAIALPFVPDNKVRLIYNGLTAPAYLTKVGARRGLIARGDLPFSPTENTVWLGTIAELHRNKGLEDGLEALNALPLGEGRGGVNGANKNWVWLIIGEGEERERLAKQIKTLGLERQVYLLGNIPEAAKWLKAFDIFLLPSHKEGLPYAILEAGLARRCVLASQAGGLPEIITAGQNGLLFPPGDVHILARALSQLINNKAEREQFGRRLTTVISQKFSLPRLVKETMTLYNE